MRLRSQLFFLCSIIFSRMTYAQHKMAGMTPAMRPITAKSNESTKKQLAFARAEGDSVDHSLAWLLMQKNTGQIMAGEYKISYAIGAAEGWYEWSGNTVHWQEPTADSRAHLWVFIQDGADGRVVPPQNIHYKITDEAANVISEGPLRFAWMPLINGYGENTPLPKAGNYTLTITLEAMPFRRHDPYNGDRFTQPTTAVATLMLDPQQLQNERLSEAMEGQKELAEHEGKAYDNTVHEMYKQANDGRDTTFGDYIVTYAIEYAEGYWHYEGDKFRYMAENDMSGKTNGHVEVSVRDAGTGRFMHGLDVTATLTKADGTSVSTKNVPFMWHPWLYHYGENWRVPKSDRYNLVLHIPPPSGRRYGKNAGAQFTRSIDLTFNNITVKAGQK